MEKENNMSLELRPDIAEGKYSNLAIITHSPNEFIVDFAQMLPGIPKAHICSRIIMTPQNAKRLLGALTDNINKYEGNFGTISPDGPATGNTLNLSDFMQGGNGSKS